MSEMMPINEFFAWPNHNHLLIPFKNNTFLLLIKKNIKQVLIFRIYGNFKKKKTDNFEILLI